MPRLQVLEAVRRADERDAGEVRVVEVGADPDERPLRAEARAQEVEHGSALLEHLEQAPVGPQLVGPELVQHAGRAADVERLLLGLEHVRERRAQPLEERPLALRERRRPRSGCAGAARRGCRPATVSFRYWPAQSARPASTGSLEREEPLRHASGRGDHDDHDDVRLEQQDLDVPHDRRLERRRRDEREQVREVGERLGRRAQRRVDLALGAARDRASSSAGRGSSRSSRRSTKNR